MNDFGNIDPDLQLFGAVRKGDRSAFEQLFQKYYTDLCHYAWTYLEIELTKGKREVTEDDEREADALCKRHLECWREEQE